MQSKTGRRAGNLFDDIPEEPRSEPLTTGAVILRKFALQDEAAILDAVDEVVAKAHRLLRAPGRERLREEVDHRAEPGALRGQTKPLAVARNVNNEP